MKSSFDFLVPENMDSMLLKLCELILSSVHFSGLRGGSANAFSGNTRKNAFNDMCLQKF